MTMRGEGSESLRPDRIEKMFPAGQDSKKELGSQTSFESYMQQAPTQSEGVTPGAKGISPFDLAHTQTALTQGPTMQTIMAQMTQTHGMLGDLQTKLLTPKLQLKSSQKYLLKNKLTEASQLLQAVNRKAGGTDVNEEPKQATGPLGKFINLLTSGQHQLNEAKHQVAQLTTQGQSLRPGDLLLIQLKVNKAQQQIEYSSVLLSKALEDFKTMMNIQL